MEIIITGIIVIAAGLILIKSLKKKNFGSCNGCTGCSSKCSECKDEILKFK